MTMVHTTHLPINDLKAWEDELSKGDVYWSVSRGRRMSSCDQRVRFRDHWLPKPGRYLICDEIQWIVDDQGKFFAHQWLGIKPDLISSSQHWQRLPYGRRTYFSWFQTCIRSIGKPLSVVTTWLVLPLWLSWMWWKRRTGRNAKVGDYFIDQLKELQKTEKHITDVRGRGLMIGVEFDIPQKPSGKKLVYEQHCFTGCASTNILRLLPPPLLQ